MSNTTDNTTENTAPETRAEKLVYSVSIPLGPIVGSAIGIGQGYLLLMEPLLGITAGGIFLMELCWVCVITKKKFNLFSRPYLAFCFSLAISHLITGGLTLLALYVITSKNSGAAFVSIVSALTIAAFMPAIFMSLRQHYPKKSPSLAKYRK